MNFEFFVYIIYYNLFENLPKKNGASGGKECNWF